MEIEKLIERLNGLYTALREEGEQKCSPEINTVTFVLMDAATSLSTLQAKNESLLAEVEHWRNAHHQAALNFQQENRECNKVLAELEQVRQCIEIVEHQRDEAIYDMTALMAGQCCDLCAVEYCNDRGKTEMCTAFKWLGQKEADHEASDI